MSDLGVIREVWDLTGSVGSGCQIVPGIFQSLQTWSWFRRESIRPSAAKAVFLFIGLCAG
jgi:hypothetical protein